MTEKNLFTAICTFERVKHCRGSIAIKILSLMGALILLYISSVYVRAYQAEKNAAEIAEKTMRTIATPWSYEKIDSMLSLASKASPQKSMIDKVSAAAELLGSLDSITSKPTCKLSLGVDTYSQKEYTYAKCQMDILFQKGSGKILLTLVHQAEQWRMNDFTIDNVETR